MRYIKKFSEIGVNDVALVGGKNANMGEMYQNLTKLGVKVPNGFAVTAEAYKYILDYNNLWDKLHNLLDNFNPDDVEELQAVGKKCRELIYSCEIPQDLEEEILEGYNNLKIEYGEKVSLAVRSSATAEDSPEASFAGQNDTYLNIKGEENLLNSYKRCLASNFTDRSIHYKFDNNFDYFSVYLCVTIMKMVRSDVGASGVMFSLDTETGFRDVVFITAGYGLGENIVQGSIKPDIFYVHKPTFKNGYRAVLKRELGKKELTMIFNDVLNENNIALEWTKNIETPLNKRDSFSITDEDVMILADYAIKVEEHYSNLVQKDKPMDMEWAKDGIDGEIYMVQARPETVESQKKGSILETYHLLEKGEVILTGSAVGTKIGSGTVRVINSLEEMDSFQEGEILVAKTTTPDWEPIMKRASGLITETGGRTCHSAIVSRELGIPAIVGVENVMNILKTGDKVTISCAEGDIGKVYKGILKYKKEEVNISDIPELKTEIMMNLGNPDIAFSLASLPVDGIGLARMEFIINEYIKAHPMALLYPEKTDTITQKKIKELTKAYQNSEEFFIKTLSEGVATIASSVYPKPCVVRMSDFKTNEYATLLGGRFFEPKEDNPMIGFRGASRYYNPIYEEGFGLECKAMKRVRDEMGFKNVILMIPFCRRVEEGKKVIKTMEKYGLKQGENGLQIYVMCEIPNNVILIDKFSEIFDGFSIGSNDLTQLTLGVDRDSEIVANDYDERDEGVKEMIKMAVRGAKRNNRHSGLCGQAPSDYPEMAKFLYELGIDSISLNPDSVIKVKKLLGEYDENRGL
jgi:pyruvate,water dikinase